MRRTASPRVEGYAVLTAAGLAGALALRRPELAVAAAPFALVLLLGLRLARDPGVQVRLALDTDRTLEDSRVGAEISVRAEAGVDRLELMLDLPAGVEVADAASATAVRIRKGEDRAIGLDLRCRRWGVYDVGDIEVRARDVLRIVVWEQRFRLRQALKAYPKPESVQRLLAPFETQALTGSDVARAKGDGIEYADIRDYVAGDRLRSINWRASARRDVLVVNERHPERNTDVVLFVDSFSDLSAPGRSTLDDAVRAAATLATRYLDRRDRVGLVSFGGVLRWLQPGMGVVQRYRLIESLLETGVEPTYVWRNVNVIPARILPSKALVLALTPLIDPRFVTALQDLRARGYDLAAVEVDPVGVVQPGKTAAERVAYRLWILQRETLRARLLGLGIAVSRWDEHRPLEVALEEVRTFRRYARLARV
jgi:uncharacterized protein (DUF58 family)